jgi:adenylosuccinate lyase
MAALWEPKKKFDTWLEIELLVCEALAELGEVPPLAVKKIRKQATYTIERIDEIEATVKHDVVAFLTAVAENVGEESRYIHLGLTSSDILDTSLALLMREAADIILEDLRSLGEVLKRRAQEHKYTPMMGRSHGIHAEPITLGLKLALWYLENQRNIERMEKAREVVSYGKISGAVGTFANTPPFVEEYVCNRLGLKPAPISTQIIQRDRHAEYMAALAFIGTSLEKFATEIRHLQRTEVLEAEEYFSKGQKGSSAMPHKRNPILSEQICGLARLLRGYALAALENVPLWHERDISHSSVERIIIPDGTMLVDYLLWRFTNIIDQLIIYPENMKKNLERTGGLIYSQLLMLELAKGGLTREEAYALVQRNALRAWENGDNFKELVLKDQDILAKMSQKAIENCFNLDYHLKYVDEIFQRVGI